MRSISESFRIRNKCQIVSVVFFDVNLQAHDSIFCEIFICLWTCWILITIYKLKEFIHRTSLNSVPSEKWVCSRQNWIVTKKTFTALIWTMAQFVFIKLSYLNEIWPIKKSFALWKINFDFSATPSTLLVKCHIFIMFGYCIFIRSCSNIKH